MPDPLEVAYLVDRFTRRIASGVHAKAVVIDTERVGPIGGMLLLTLSEIEPAPIHRLVAQMGRDKSQMTRAIKVLEEKGMLDRAPCAEDGRVSLVQLTEKGRAFVRQINVILSEVINGILAPISEQERQSLIAMLRKI